MTIGSSSRLRRSLIAGAGIIAMSTGVLSWNAAPALAAPFSMSLVGGSFSLGGQATAAIGGASTACQNGSDDEFVAPFGTPDGLIDYPADPQCASPFDNDETVAGVQPPVPGIFSGTIDGASNFSVSSTFPSTTFVVTQSVGPLTGLCDDDVFVAKAITTFTDLANHTGNLNAGTLTLNLRIDNTLDIQCDTDLGAGVSYSAFDIDGPGGQAPWGGATPVSCAHDVSSLNTSLSGDSASASLTKTQSPAVTAPMTGKDLKPAKMFGDVFDAVPITGADTRCPFFASFVFGTSAADNSAVQFAFMVNGATYDDLAGIDVNVGDVTLYEGDGGYGALGCAGGTKNCTNRADVVVSLSSPALVDSTITVIADNTTSGTANGTLKGTEAVSPNPDYKHTTALKPKVLKIKAGKSTAKFAITITPDQVDEGTETIHVEVIAVSAGLVENDGVGMVTILDDDDATEPDTGINVGDATVYETGQSVSCGGALKCKGTAVIPIVAQSAVGVDTALSYTIMNGTDVVAVFDAAEAVDGKTVGDDFSPVLVAKVKTIKTGKNTLGLVVTIFGDNTLESGVFHAETLTVFVTGAGVRDGIGTIRINNDDV